jgi:3-methyl-2-oxobutanoate hydroxymethyltransferase
LVGDILGNVVLGYGITVTVTLDEILIHLKAVRRGVQRALLVADMPYGSFHTGADDAVRNALRLVKEVGAEAVKL